MERFVSILINYLITTFRNLIFLFPDCIGGFNCQAGIKQCDVYDPNNDQWTSIAPLHTGRCQAGVAAYKGKLWVVGGSDGWNCLGTVETYDPDTNQWSFASPLLTSRRGCGVAILDGKLWCVGGSDGSQSLKTTEYYDEATQAWVTGPSLTTSRSIVSAVVVQDSLYAIGGFSGKKFLNTIEYFDAEANEWTKFAKLQPSLHDALYASDENGDITPQNYANVVKMNGETQKKSKIPDTKMSTEKDKISEDESDTIIMPVC